MAQSLASPPEEGKRKPPSRQVFCWDAAGFVKNKCGLETQQKIGLFPISKGYPAISVYITQKISKTQFPVKQSKVSTPFKTWIVSTRITPKKINQNMGLWTCFGIYRGTVEVTGSQLREQCRQSGTHGNQASTVVTWWWFRSQKMILPIRYHPCMVHLPTFGWFLYIFMANL